ARVPERIEGERRTFLQVDTVRTPRDLIADRNEKFSGVEADAYRRRTLKRFAKLIGLGPKKLFHYRRKCTRIAIVLSDRSFRSAPFHGVRINAERRKPLREARSAYDRAPATPWSRARPRPVRSGRCSAPGL